MAVVGHAGYYPKSGFSPGSRYCLTCDWHGVPDTAFTVRLFGVACEGVISGDVSYRKEIDKVARSPGSSRAGCKMI